MTVHDSLVTLPHRSLWRLQVELHREVEYMASLDGKALQALSALQNMFHYFPVPVHSLACVTPARSEPYPPRTGYDQTMCQHGDARAYNEHSGQWHCW